LNNCFLSVVMHWHIEPFFFFFFHFLFDATICAEEKRMGAVWCTFVILFRLFCMYL
jgi:hypothetical protein